MELSFHWRWTGHVTLFRPFGLRRSNRPSRSGSRSKQPQVSPDLQWVKRSDLQLFQNCFDLMRVWASTARKFSPKEKKKKNHSVVSTFLTSSSSDPGSGANWTAASQRSSVFIFTSRMKTPTFMLRKTSVLGVGQFGDAPQVASLAPPPAAAHSSAAKSREFHQNAASWLAVSWTC